MAPPRINGPHTCTRHEPGTPTCYHRCRCRCRRCSLSKQRADVWRELHPQSVDAAGTRRRLQALAAAGWPMTWLDARLGYRPGRCYQTTRRQWVTLRVAAEIAELYDALWDQPSGAGREDRRARTMAATKGWAPPLAWDDDTIDDPDATPSGVVVQLRAADRYAARVDDAREMLEAGEDPLYVAERLGTNVAALAKLAERHAALDVARVMYAAGRRAS